MKALGGREAKRKIALSRPGGVQPRDGGGDNRGGLAGTLARRQEVGRSRFDGHFGIHERVQTVRDNMTVKAGALRVVG
jgi:hypothetical protein